MSKTDLQTILNNETELLNKLHDIVENSIREENLITQNLLNPPIETVTTSEKVADKVAQFGGSWKFIISFLVVMGIWITFNVLALTADRFDPFPFILLNLILSCIAAIQAPIIMMSQNRVEEKDRKRSENDYLINLKAEIQIRSLHQKIDLLQEEQIKSLFETQALQMKMLKTIEEKLEKHLKA